MAELYAARNTPQKYDSSFYQEELQRIALVFEYLEIPVIRLTPNNTAPTRAFEGDIRLADGTNWNPGSGAGIYAYISGAWTKL